MPRSPQLAGKHNSTVPCPPEAAADADHGQAGTVAIIIIIISIIITIIIIIIVEVIAMIDR